MTTPNKLNEFNHAEDPARRLLERLGWTYVPAEQLASERATERDVLLKDRVRAALLRLNDGMTGSSGRAGHLRPGAGRRHSGCRATS